MDKKNTIDEMDDFIISIDEIDIDIDIYNNPDFINSVNDEYVYIQQNDNIVESIVNTEASNTGHDIICNETNSVTEYTKNETESLASKIESKNNLKQRKRKRKRKRKIKKIIIFITVTTIISVGSILSYKTYRNYKIEQARLSELDKENLNLKLIIDTVDEYGGLEHQLNWKDVASVLSVQVNNYTSLISKDEILNTCSLFLNKQKKTVNDLNIVVEKLELNEKEKLRIFNYKEDLMEYGYTPDKLKLNSSQMQFINLIKEGAFESYKKTKILPSITVAQAILESNWGNSNLVKESNNLFGIKADSSWKGDFVTFETKEFHSTIIKDKFRKYPNFAESIIDHSEFLKTHSRYESNGVFEAKTYKAQAYALQEAGYSTAEDEYGNKTYANMLEVLIRQYNLQLLDWEVRYFN